MPATIVVAASSEPHFAVVAQMLLLATIKQVNKAVTQAISPLVLLVVQSKQNPLQIKVAAVVVHKMNRELVVEDVVRIRARSSLVAVSVSNLLKEQRAPAMVRRPIPEVILKRLSVVVHVSRLTSQSIAVVVAHILNQVTLITSSSKAVGLDVRDAVKMLDHQRISMRKY
jgi:hypothetical protein